jgi:hypothetical protein
MTPEEMETKLGALEKEITDLAAKNAELSDAVTRLEAAVGMAYATRHPTPTDLKPENQLPSGRYPLMLDTYQLRLTGIPPIEANVAGLAVRVKAVEDRPQIPPANSTGDFPQVVDHDVVFMGRVGIGGIYPDGRAQLHIMDNRSASILFVTNMDNAQYQGQHDHVAELALSDDSGFRRFKNAMTTISTRPETDPDTGVTYQSMMLYFPDPNKPMLIEGCDSLGQPSWDLRKPGVAYDRTQGMVMRFDPNQKLVLMECWQRGWRFKFGAEAKYGPGVWTGTMP